MTRAFRPLFTRNNRAANLTIVLLLSFGIGAAVPGAAAGLLLCLLLSRLVASALYGVRTSDPVSFSAALLGVCVIAAAASCLPVWRTLRIEPAAILRDE